jgi:hypothetical protein
VCTGDSCVYWGQLCVLGTAMCIGDSCVYQISGLCFFIRESYVRSVSRYCYICNYAVIPVQLEVVVLQYISWGVPVVWTYIIIIIIIIIMLCTVFDFGDCSTDICLFVLHCVRMFCLYVMFSFYLTSFMSDCCNDSTGGPMK